LASPTFPSFSQPTTAANSKADLLNHRIVLVYILMMCFLWGCGYTLGPPSGHAEKVALYAFSNETFKPGLEVSARDVLLQRLAAQRVPLATDSQGAAWTLKGTITRYSTEAVAFDARDISRQYRLVITINFVFQEKEGQRTLWEESLTASSYYYTGSDVAATEIAENHACIRAIEELSQMVATRMMEVF
jgi:hypothetical protein